MAAVFGLVAGVLLCMGSFFVAIQLGPHGATYVFVGWIVIIFLITQLFKQRH